MKMIKIFSLVLVLAGSAFTSCLWANTAVAEIKATESGSELAGEVTFEETELGLVIIANVKNAPEGRHGFHIHNNGSCADGGKAAGGHFNPNEVPHGDLVADGFGKAHAGDLGNIVIDASGEGILEKIISILTLGEGKYSVAGKAVIIHASPDDFGQPTGNAGARIGCGIVSAS